MSVFATIAVVCTMATCQDYVVDHAQTVYNGNVNTEAKSTEFLNVWDNETDLTKWLTKYQIGETVFEIVSLEFETKEIQEGDLP